LAELPAESLQFNTIKEVRILSNNFEAELREVLPTSILFDVFLWLVVRPRLIFLILLWNDSHFLLFFRFNSFLVLLHFLLLLFFLLLDQGFLALLLDLVAALDVAQLLQSPDTARNLKQGIIFLVLLPSERGLRVNNHGEFVLDSDSFQSQRAKDSNENLMHVRLLLSLQLVGIDLEYFFGFFAFAEGQDDTVDRAHRVELSQAEPVAADVVNAHRVEIVDFFTSLQES